MSLSLQLQHFHGVLVVRIHGELDHHAAVEVRRTLDNEIDKGAVQNLVLNMANLEFMDSSGLGVILGRYNKITQPGGKMMLCSIRPSVYRLMEMSGLFKIMPIYEDERSAIAACGVAS